MPKYKEFNEMDPTPREAMCIRSDNEVYEGGGDPDHKLMEGAIYFVESVHVFKWHTILHIRGVGDFNSVLFAELE